MGSVYSFHFISNTVNNHAITITHQDASTYIEVTASDLITALDDVTGTSGTFGNILSLFLNLKFFLLN